MTDLSTSPVAPPDVVGWLVDRPGIRLLDQTRLPSEEVYLELESAEAVAEAIISLRVRGAPAIGVAAAMGLAVGMSQVDRADGEAGMSAPVTRAAFDDLVSLLTATRPTGRNLAWALGRMRTAFEEGPTSAGTSTDAIGWATPATRVLLEEAEAIRREDCESCHRIGEAGLALIPPEGAGVLTHCNAGALATAGIGTALAPIYLAQDRAIPLRVFSCETRPVLQGARLTAWELTRSGIDVTVVTDSMAAALMASGEVNLVIVGADAVAANGDVVNKIGTYALAVLARHHGLPFYVALPRSTFDRSLGTGAEVPIESRARAEVTTIGSATLVPEGAEVWNPAFDLTPEHLVTALVTDGGVIRPPYGPAIVELLG